VENLVDSAPFLQLENEAYLEFYSNESLSLTALEDRYVAEYVSNVFQVPKNKLEKNMRGNRVYLLSRDHKFYYGMRKGY
jgi:hypothetical protein